MHSVVSRGGLPQALNLQELKLLLGVKDQKYNNPNFEPNFEPQMQHLSLRPLSTLISPLLIFCFTYILIQNETHSFTFSFNDG